MSLVHSLKWCPARPDSWVLIHAADTLIVTGVSYDLPLRDNSNFSQMSRKHLIGVGPANRVDTQCGDQSQTRAEAAPALDRARGDGCNKILPSETVRVKV